MHRLLSTRSELDSNYPQLSHDALKHLKVLRPKNGEKIELFDGNGFTRVYKYNQQTKSLEPESDLTHHHRPRQSVLTLFACVTKGARWDWTIEKATELGADNIVPVISARTVVRVSAVERTQKRERWQRIAEEAARQSDAVYIPVIHEPVDFSSALSMANRTQCYAGALLDRKIPGLATALFDSLKTNCVPEFSVFIGPEGDFTEDEMRSLLDVASPVTFGPRVLRAETAAVYALSVMTSILDGFGLQ